MTAPMMLEATLAYPERLGLRVFPCYEILPDGSCACGNRQCSKPGKHPRTRHGCSDATSDRAIITDWWSQWPNANVAIACEPLVAIDADLKRGGLQSLQRLRERLGAYRTARALTGGGGTHDLFLAPAGAAIRSRSNAFGEQFPGIDIKARGGYIIAPPSLHASGRRYEWDILPTPFSLAELPGAWLQAILATDPAQSHRPIPGVDANAAARIPAGQRHDALTRYAGRLRRLGTSVEEIEDCLRSLNARRCDPPYIGAELEHELRGILNAATGWPTVEDMAIFDGVTNDARWNAGAAGFRSWKELLEAPEVSTDWLVDGMLPRGGSSLWVAKPKVGKSTSVQNLAHATACDHDFLGHAVVSGAVLYLALEEKESEVRKHFEAMGTAEDAPLYFYFARTPDDGLSWLRNAIEQYKPVLVIVDTFQKFTRVRDIKDYAIVTNKMDPIMALARESGAHVAFTHHGTKAQSADPGDAALGSTALFGGVDTLVYLHKTQNYRTIGTIQRYGDDLPETILSLDAATWTISLGSLRRATDRTAAGKAILDFLADCPEPIDEPTIREEVGGRTQDLAPALRELVRNGAVIRSGGGRRGDPYLYVINRDRYGNAAT